MKRIGIKRVICVTVLGCLLLALCGAACGRPAPAMTLNPPEGVTMSLVSWTSDAVIVTIKNNSGGPWSYGDSFGMLNTFLTDGEADETYSLAAYGQLPPGTYRLVVNGLSVEGVVQ